jgi:Predicted outer membrane protein
MKLGVAIFTLVTCFGAGWTAETGKNGKLASSDAAFVKEAAQGGMLEVELGKIAQTKAADAKVKEFGKKMEQDHGKANDELKKLAAGKGVQLPNELDSKHKSTVTKLEKLSSAKFDKAYMDAMVSDHKTDVKKFTSESEKSKDADLQKFATDTLPTLKSHLQLAESTAKDIKEVKATSPSKPSK